MLGILHAEWLRLQRTFTPIFVGVLPVSLVLLAALLSFQLLHVNRQYYQWLLLNWWPLLWLPFGVALLASHTMRLEKRAGTWKALRSRPIAPAKLYLGKLLVLTTHTLVSALLLVLLSLLTGLLVLNGEVPWQLLCNAVLMTWLATLPLVALMLWAAFVGGYALTISLTLLGSLLGAITALTDNWFLVPWALPLRMATPLAGIHPNGVPLQSSDPAWQLPIGPIVGVALAGYVLFTVLGTLWFVRKEVK
jgi:ABC-2 type transport system permease protein